MVIPLTRDKAELLLGLIATSVEHEELLIQSDKHDKITIPELQTAEDEILEAVADAFPYLKQRYANLYEHRTFDRDYYYLDQYGWPSSPMELNRERQ